MRLSTQIALVLVPALILACTLPALAGALPPCVKAVSSNNRNFLVTSDAQLKSEQVLDSSNSRSVPGCPLSLITDDG